MTHTDDQIRTLTKAAQMLRERSIRALREAGFNDHAGRLSNGGKDAPELRFPLRVKTLKELRVAAVMDQFSLCSYAPECVLSELTPEGWKNEIDDFKPDLIFIESAWQGKDKLWFRKIANGSPEYFAMTSYCQEKAIPIVFWNKEDPIYTDVFIPAAQMADAVFTTDIDCVRRYKEALGHDRVYHLHFAAQPRIHNPIEKFERKDKFCFAGAYYQRYPLRAKVFDAFYDIFSARGGLDIYDRNHNHPVPEYAFPPQYEKDILGELSPDQIDVAYKGYLYGVNMNSVQQSQTMFARRAFEMLASNTVTVGNYSRGVKNYFGDLTVCTDDSRTLGADLDRYCASAEDAARYRLAGLRKVLKEHLYEDRLAYIVKKVFGQDLKPALPHVSCFAVVTAQDEAKRVQEMFGRQTYQNASLRLLKSGEAGAMTARDLSEEGYIAFFDEKSWYGDNYLWDLIHTLRYGAWDAIGKADPYSAKNGVVCAPKNPRCYREVEGLPARCAILRASAYADTPLSELLNEKCVTGESLFSADEFNFCADCPDDHCERAADIKIADTGLSLDEIELAAECVRPITQDGDGISGFGPSELHQMQAPDNPLLTLHPRDEGIEIVSALPADGHATVYHSKTIPVETFAGNHRLPVLFQGGGGCDALGVCRFLRNGKVVAQALYPRLNRAETLEIPAKATHVQIGLRLKGAGSCVLRSVKLGDTGDNGAPACFLSRSVTLLLTNQYPTPDNLYRNMFVHKRAVCYREAGMPIDVMRMNQDVKPGYYEFEGVNVIDGGAASLDAILSNGRIKTVCVHFLNDTMWSVLRQHADHIRIITFSHGIDIQKWERRKCNYSTDAEIERAKALSAVREAMWRDVFEKRREMNIHFVFVSRTLAEEVFADYGVSLDESEYSIIHNCVDAALYAYAPRKAEDRLKLLSVRSYAYFAYANDLTVRCIQALAEKPYFSELSFALYGNGDLFDSTVAPLRKYKNVTIEKRFLRQSEIVELYGEYGLLLIPTRLDTQGVSRDEGMARGMVPVTSAVCAVPEFCDDSCAILAPGEDWRAMAEGIDRLYRDPDRYLRMSAAAAARARSQLSDAQTVSREIALIKGRGEKA